MTAWIKIPGILEALGQCVADKWSASQAADKISRLAGQFLSRNAMIGAAKRRGMKFQSVDVGTYNRGPKKPRKPRRKFSYEFGYLRSPLPPLEITETPVQQGFLGLTFQELEPGQCKFPQGSGPYLFCGATAIEDEPYCAYHHRITHIGFSAGFNKTGVSNELFRATQNGSLPHSAGRSRSF